MYLNKKCEKCNEDLINVFHTTRYCDDCKKILRVQNYKKQNKRISENRHSDEELRENFFKLVKEPYHLTIKGFNEISKFNSNIYVRFYKMNWFEILIQYEKSELLIKYIVDEYKQYIKESNHQDFNEFAKNHKYIGKRLINSVGEDKLRELANVRKLRNNDEDYTNNFYNIVKQIGRIPIFPEFYELTTITLTNYANHLNLKGKLYDNIVKYYVTEEEYNNYLERRKLYKSLIGAETGKLSATYYDQDYENEFHRVFKICINEYGEMPTRRLFNELSTIDESAYRGKYKRSWTDICEMYGYKIDRTANKSEKTSLEVVKSILDEDYTPQKTFPWLRGINDFLLYCDGYFQRHGLIIEFDGRQHREPVDDFGGEERFKVVIANDKIKDTLIPKHGLKLIRISSEEPYWNKEYIQNKLIQNNAI